MSIRPATPTDVPVILQQIRDLAEFEKSLDQVEATETNLREALFNDQPHVFAHVAEHSQDGETTIAGYVVWFLNFSTWNGRHGIYVEDIYVRPEMRRFGYGRAMFEELGAIARQQGYKRMDFWVLKWNKAALDFYERLGAVEMDDWVPVRITGSALDNLGAGL